MDQIVRRYPIAQIRWQEHRGVAVDTNKARGHGAVSHFRAPTALLIRRAHK
ncbi:hypothetical protein BH20VER1_BH20VER1_05580 [soil metagenome]